MGACDESFGVSLGETAPSADLGGSSKYSNENFEGRSGEGFHVNSRRCPPTFCFTRGPILFPI